MKVMKTFIRIIFVLIFVLNCKADKDFSITDNPLKRLILLEAISYNPYIKLIETAMGKWELGLEYKLAIERDQKTNTPKNWIQNSAFALCNEPDLQSIKPVCQLNVLTLYYSSPELGLGLMGFCNLAVDDYGDVKNTTLVLNSNNLHSERYSDSDKINSIAHELGHCLGLAHVSDYGNIMYPYLIPNKTDYKFNQRDLLRRAYLENLWDDPNNYFTKNSLGRIVKHGKLPTFYVKVENTPNMKL